MIGIPDNRLQKNSSLPTQEILIYEYLLSGDRFSMIVNPSFSDHQMGFILFEFQPENRFLYEHLFIDTVRSQIHLLLKAR